MPNSPNSRNDSPTNGNAQPAPSNQTEAKKGAEQSSGHKIFEAPSIQLPKGGGAIQGIGGIFQANPVTGSASFSVPLTISPGRSGFAPQLALSYDSGSGNGPFGLGWSIGLPQITRKTSKGLPQYDGLPRYEDANDSDVFLLSGAEDLVPELKADGSRYVRHEAGFTVWRYHPRTEGLWARIEKWTAADGSTHWRSITKDNLTSIYGSDPAIHGSTPVAQIADPADSTRVFAWLLERSFDEKGNVIIYQYKKEDGAGLAALQQIFEKNRDASNAYSQQYLKRILYGNESAYDPQNPTAPNQWHFELVFDYGEHYDADFDFPVYPPTATWPVRSDPFSSYRSGFEIRSYRLCRRVLMYHHFPDEDKFGDRYLVKATHFNYDEKPVATLLNSVTHTGYRRFWTDGPDENHDEKPDYLIENYERNSFPPLEFQYTTQKIDPKIYTIDAADLPNAPEGIDGRRYRFTDLEGEGLNGILSQSDNAWHYKRNLGDGRFGPLETIGALPSLAAAGQLTDLSGDGLTDLLVQTDALDGYFTLDEDLEWGHFRAFDFPANVNLRDPNLRQIDLDGDSVADLLLTENDCFVWFASRGTEGFEAARRVAKALDEEQGPRIVFGEAQQTIFLADMCGHGLTDLVRIRNGEVCYWPNLGFGRFGAKVTMAAAPTFDHPDQFDPSRIRLADIDGAGPMDLVYLGRDTVSYWVSESGNGWGAEQRLDQHPFPRTTNLDNVSVFDLLGNGTACIVWSSPLPGAAYAPLRYVQLMGKTETEGNKPYLLKEVKNNLGAVTTMKYESSTKFYLEDRKLGRPWITKLPFPVQVLTKVKTYDAITKNAFVQHYAYHHGYFDRFEREFRGFGMVEQWDTEDYDSFTAAPDTLSVSNWEEDSHVPPVHTKTWFHTGSFHRGGVISKQFEQEYWQGDPDGWLLPDSVLPDTLTPQEVREACRALRGNALRVEVYGLDKPFLFKKSSALIAAPTPGVLASTWKNAFLENGIDFQNDLVEVTALATDQWLATNQTRPWKYVIQTSGGFFEVLDASRKTIPYTISEANFRVLKVQGQGDNRHAVFFAHPGESLSYHYEREVADPRIQHAMTLAVDAYGNVTRSAAIGYPRRVAPADFPEQARLYATVSEATFINADSATAGFYRVGVGYEQKTWELTGLDKTVNDPGEAPPDFPYTPDFLNKVFDSTKTLSLAFEEIPPVDQDPQPLHLSWAKRLIGSAYTVFYDENLSTTPLPKGQIAAHGLPFRSYELAYTPGFLAKNELKINGTPCIGNTELLAAKFEKDAAGNWWRPSPRTQFHGSAQFYLPEKQLDLFGQAYTIDYDAYHLLTTSVQTTVNGVALLTQAENDYRVLQPRRLTDPNGNHTAAAFDPLGMVVRTAVIGKNGEGDLLDPTALDPFFVVDGNDLIPDIALSDPLDYLQKTTAAFYYNLHHFRLTSKPNYAMSVMRETHLAEDLLETGRAQLSFSYSDGFGRAILTKVQAEPDPDLGQTAPPRWVGNGRTVFNNKGNPVKQYEPYFSTTYGYEDEPALVMQGVTPILHYDPLGRAVRTDLPDGTFTKVEFTPWEQKTFDQNDTVLEPGNAWYQQHTTGNAEAQRAATLAAAHANTPKVEYFDTLGRIFLLEDDNGAFGKYRTRFGLDLLGNQRTVTDAKGRLITRNLFNQLKEPVHTHSMDAGQRWLFTNAQGNPALAWNERGFKTRIVYDALQRPLATWVSDNGAPETAVHFIVYGERDPNALAHNLLGQAWRQYDSAGLLTQDEFDFKGNLLSGSRRPANTYQTTPEWANVAAVMSAASPPSDGGLATAEPLLEPTDSSGKNVFTSATTYDALRRPVQATAPDGSKITYAYNEANLLEKLTVAHSHASQSKDFVQNIDYDAKGQRTKIQYGNGLTTTYSYDPLTFRLTRLLSTRSGDNAVLQDLSYFYDPVGNITDLRDEAQKTVFFNNSVVEAHGAYTYDALYRLLTATGREHIGQSGQHDDPQAFQFVASPTDGSALRNYTQEFTYDELGNIEQVHQLGVWTRKYRYDAPSPLEPSLFSNRLTKTSLDDWATSAAYTHDVHGNMSSMPHLVTMDWDYADRLQRIDLQGGGEEYYAYDAGGQRSRKVWHKPGGLVCERFYVGGFEVYRERNSAGTVLILERETLHIMDDKSRIAVVDTLTKGVSTGELIGTLQTRYQLSNHLGSAALELDAAAALITYEEYYPFGASSYRAGRTEREVKAKLYRYCGKERDGSSGLDYYEMRYYAAWLCRFVSVDALKDKYPFYTTYQYAGNMPIVFIDLDGLEPARVGTGDNTTGTLSISLKFQADPSEGMTPGQLINYATSYASNVSQVWNATHDGVSVNTNGVQYTVAHANLPSFAGTMEIENRATGSTIAIHLTNQVSDSDPTTATAYGLNAGEALVMVGAGKSLNPNQRYQSFNVPNNVSFVRGNFSYMFSPKNADDAAHEFGHFFGLEDRYTEALFYNSSLMRVVDKKRFYYTDILSSLGSPTIDIPVGKWFAKSGHILTL